MLEGIKILIERLNDPETSDDWMDMALSVVREGKHEDYPAFTPEEVTAVHEAVVTARRRAFTARVMGKLSGVQEETYYIYKSAMPKAEGARITPTNKVLTPAAILNNSLTLLEKEFSAGSKF
jgi:hypothetical protein